MKAVTHCPSGNGGKPVAHMWRGLEGGCVSIQIEAAEEDKATYS